MTGYGDPNSTHNPATGTSPPAAWGDLVRDDIVWLAGDNSSGNPKPMARVYKTFAHSVATATSTVITFDAERYDVGGCHSTSSNTSRLTVPSGGGGVYHIGASAVFAANATGIRSAGIFLNGATLIAVAEATTVSAGADIGLCPSCDYKLAAGDYVELRVYQTSGGILNVTFAGNYSPEMWFHWVGVG